jgi:hypothetical protein
MSEQTESDCVPSHRSAKITGKYQVQYWVWMTTGTKVDSRSSHSSLLHGTTSQLCQLPISLISSLHLLDSTMLLTQWLGCIVLHANIRINTSTHKPMLSGILSWCSTGADIVDALSYRTPWWVYLFLQPWWVAAWVSKEPAAHVSLSASGTMLKPYLTVYSSLFHYVHSK